MKGVQLSAFHSIHFILIRVLFYIHVFRRFFFVQFLQLKMKIRFIQLTVLIIFFTPYPCATCSCESTVLKRLVHPLWVTTSMVGLCIGSGSKRPKLLLSQQVVNLTSYGGLMVWMFRREVFYLKFHYYTSIVESLFYPTLLSFSEFWDRGLQAITQSSVRSRTSSALLHPCLPT